MDDITSFQYVWTVNVIYCSVTALWERYAACFHGRYINIVLHLKLFGHKSKAHSKTVGNKGCYGEMS